MNRFYFKSFAALLAALLFFTFVSRAADSFLVTRVTAENPSAKKIEHIVTAEGLVEKNTEFPVLTEAGCIVRTVYVQEGERVEEGQILADVLLDELEEQIQALRGEIAVLKLQTDAAETNARLSKEARERQLARAEEDYERAVQEKERAVQEAKEALAAAERAIGAFSADSGSAEDGQEEAIDALWQAYFEKQKALAAAEREGETNIEAARRAREEAGAQVQADNSAEINRISAAQKEKELAGYEALLAADGKITAPRSGTVTSVCVQTGQRTPDTAAFAMASADGGVRITADISAADAAYVDSKDAAVVEKNGKNYEGFTVTGIAQAADGMVRITVTGEEAPEVFGIGDGARITVKKQSKLYGTAVPRSAVHTEQGNHYVYVIEERETVIGTQFFTRKVQIQILDKNSSYAAVQEGSLGAAERVVTAAERYIQAGDRVRPETP